MDFKYLKDYLPEIQARIYEKYGVKINLADIRQIVFFPFKNIITAMMRGDRVLVKGYFFIDRIIKKGGQANPRQSQPPG